jgi:hypothetical protein
MGYHGQGFLVKVSVVIGERHPCPYGSVSFPLRRPPPERGPREGLELVHDEHFVGITRNARWKGSLIEAKGMG